MSGLPRALLLFVAMLLGGCADLAALADAKSRQERRLPLIDQRCAPVVVIVIHQPPS